GWRGAGTRTRYWSFPHRCLHGRPVLAVPPTPARRPDHHRDRPSHHDDGRELRVGRGRAPASAPGRGDGRLGVERKRGVRFRGHAVSSAGLAGTRRAVGGCAALPRALAPRGAGSAAARAPGSGRAAHPLGAARGGRAGPGARNSEARAGGPSHSAFSAERPRGRARHALGACGGVCRGALVETPVTRLALERVTFRYPATEAPALVDVSLEVAAGEVVAIVGSVGAGASTLL